MPAAARGNVEYPKYRPAQQAAAQQPLHPQHTNAVVLGEWLARGRATGREGRGGDLPGAMTRILAGLRPAMRAMLQRISSLSATTAMHLADKGWSRRVAVRAAAVDRCGPKGLTWDR
jgi:hypothetical protein